MSASDAPEHPTRVPRWGVSAYSGADPVALGAWAAGPACPCGCTAHVEGEPASECSACESFRCARCERWCSWEMGGCDDTPALCDDCAYALDGGAP